MPDINYLSAKKEKTIRIIYVYAVEMNDEKTAISKLKYVEAKGDGKWSEPRFIDVNSLSKSIYNDEIIAWAGRVDNKNNKFTNVCKVVPQIIDGQYYVTSVTDGDVSNNLENLPGYVKDN